LVVCVGSCDSITHMRLAWPLRCSLLRPPAFRPRCCAASEPVPFQDAWHLWQHRHPGWLRV